jgi:hypothetical protein
MVKNDVMRRGERSQSLLKLLHLLASRAEREARQALYDRKSILNPVVKLAGEVLTLRYVGARLDHQLGSGAEPPSTLYPDLHAIGPGVAKHPLPYAIFAKTPVDIFQAPRENCVEQMV